jgi:hypothetical protein
VIGTCWSLELKSGCIGFQGLKEALRRRGVFHKTIKVYSGCELIATMD